MTFVTTQPDRCGHTDCHRYQPWGYQLYVMGEPTPSPSQEEGNKKEDGTSVPSSSLIVLFGGILSLYSKFLIDLEDREGLI